MSVCERRIARAVTAEIVRIAGLETIGTLAALSDADRRVLRLVSD